MNARMSMQTLNRLNDTEFTFSWNSVVVKTKASVSRSNVLVAAASAWTCDSCGVAIPTAQKNEHLVGPDHLAHVRHRLA